MRTRFIAALALAAVASIPAAAQPKSDEPEYTSIYSVLQRGYEIKSTSFVNADQAPALTNNKGNVPLMIITLQKGNSIAICSCNAYNWIYAIGATFSNEELCKIRPAAQ